MVKSSTAWCVTVRSLGGSYITSGRRRRRLTALASKSKADLPLSPQTQSRYGTRTRSPRCAIRPRVWGSGLGVSTEDVVEYDALLRRGGSLLLSEAPHSTFVEGYDRQLVTVCRYESLSVSSNHPFRFSAHDYLLLRPRT